MKEYISYMVPLQPFKDVITSRLFSYAPLVNIDECLRYLIHDFFNAKFLSPYNYMAFNNCLVFVNQGKESAMTPEMYEFVAKALWSSFWPTHEDLSYILKHCSYNDFAARVHECYFDYQPTGNLMVYVPVGTAIIDPTVQRIPEQSLVSLQKGGTV